MIRNVVLVGCGNMGSAMLMRWLPALPETAFWVVEPNEGLREKAAEIGAKTRSEPDGLPEDLDPDLIILAVKPQVMSQIAPQYAGFVDACFVSIAAGVTMSALSGWIGEVALIRTMPNTPAAIGQGMLISVANDKVSDRQRTATEALMTHSGRHSWLEDESLMDAVTAISGSGPAYLFHFIEVLREAAIRLGLPEDLAGEMALQTVSGAAVLAQGADEGPGKLRQNVTSPKGTTEAALNVLMGRLGPLVTEAVTAARDRGRELASG